VKYKMFLWGLLSLLLGACGTMNPLRIAQPTPAVTEPLVVSPACLAPPVEAQPVDEPPMPEPLERPSGEPNATNYPIWMGYFVRRAERAELAGLFFQGERDAYEDAYELTAEQMRQCNAWAAEAGE
jgi:hypothetical protein